MSYVEQASIINVSFHKFMNSKMYATQYADHLRSKTVNECSHLIRADSIIVLLCRLDSKHKICDSSAFTQPPVFKII